MQHKGASWEKEKAGRPFSTMRVNHLTNRVFNILTIIENSIDADRFWVTEMMLCNLMQLGVYFPVPSLCPPHPCPRPPK